MLENITIKLNGEEKLVGVNMTVNKALAQWGLDQGKFALAINNSFLPKSQYVHYQLAPGDKIDLLHPVAGG